MGKKVVKMAKSKTKSTHTDGSSGEKISVDNKNEPRSHVDLYKNICQRCGKGKLVQDDETGEKFCSRCGVKPIVTYLGSIKNAEEKEDIFCELNLVEDRKVKDAERALFRRLNRDARCEAWTWSQYYKDLVGDPHV